VHISKLKRKNNMGLKDWSIFGIGCLIIVISILVLLSVEISSEKEVFWLEIGGIALGFWTYLYFGVLRKSLNKIRS